MQRVVIMGPPGSGKSTLARQLGALCGLPVFHLDQAFWRPGWVEAAPDAFRAEVERLAGLPAWIIEGNYTDTLAPRLAAADTLIYLDVPTSVSTMRVIKRLLTNFRRVRRDAAPGCPERLDLSFLRFTWSWNRLRRARNLDIVAGFEGRRVVLRTRADRRRLLAAAAPGR
jgi:adenylate kinase family enzyme